MLDGALYVLLERVLEGVVEYDLVDAGAVEYERLEGLVVVVLREPEAVAAEPESVLLSKLLLRVLVLLLAALPLRVP